MAVVNITPDSFSDGGRWDTAQAAVAHGRDLVAQGADIIDVGGESTRPGAQRVDAATEAARVLPVIRELAEQTVVSVDTTRAATAEAALEAGASIINDVSGGLADPAMHRLVAESGAIYICQHWRGSPETMDTLTDYPQGVVAGVTAELRARLDELAAAGAQAHQIVVDPGLGFAKTHEQSWQLLAATGTLGAELGHPVLIGASRKRFLSLACDEGAAPAQRDAATAATTALAAASGAWAVRVHEVPANRDALRTASLWKEHQ
ncbi:dihydropteroate synthase [Actinomyces slackii]|uniref:dihydropteroate synthase n=2 Tax=Actinomyces slackii TaxID=52774 RepID=A0A3S4TBY2_9ACTO|nr:Dihydropteroate synthase 1 [Actinomyces slackii]